MPRPIDGDVLVTSLEQSYKNLRELCGSIKEGEGAKEVYQGELITFLEAILRVREMPTLDYEPVRHNQWALHEMNPHRVTVDGYVVCLECEHTFDRIKGTWFKRCPNCGAKMDAKEDENA